MVAGRFCSVNYRSYVRFDNHRGLFRFRMADGRWVRQSATTASTGTLDTSQTLLRILRARDSCTHQHHEVSTCRTNKRSNISQRLARKNSPVQTHVQHFFQIEFNCCNIEAFYSGRLADATMNIDPYRCSRCQAGRYSPRRRARFDLTATCCSRAENTCFSHRSRRMCKFWRNRNKRAKISVHDKRTQHFNGR